MTGLRSGQVADAAGVNPQTLRYYERRGLLPEPARTLGGHRVYPPDTVAVLRVIKTAQRLGFTLEEVADLLETAAHGHGHRSRLSGARPAGGRGGLHDRAVAKLAEVNAKIADLEIIRDTLQAAVEQGCDDLLTCADTEDCPIPFPALAESAAVRVTATPDAGDAGDDRQSAT